MIGYLKKSREEQGRKTKWVYSELARGYIEVFEAKNPNNLEMELNKDTGVYEVKNDTRKSKNC